MRHDFPLTTDWILTLDWINRRLAFCAYIHPRPRMARGTAPPALLQSYATPSRYIPIIRIKTRCRITLSSPQHYAHHYSTG